jgi:1,2-phenylacetyl-CoA epoxidase catalytic subunit
MTIKKAIQDELEHRGWSHYRLVKELEGKIPARTIYAYLSGERDLASEGASIILKTLGLKIKR